MNLCMVAHLWSTNIFGYDKLWGPSQRVVTLFVIFTCYQMGSDRIDCIEGIRAISMTWVFPMIFKSYTLHSKFAMVVKQPYQIIK